MIFCFPHHGEEETKRLVFMAQAGQSLETSAQIQSPEKQEAESLPQVSYRPGMTHDEAWQVIDEKCGRNAYESIISRYLDRIMPRSAEEHKEALLARYMSFYDRFRDLFMKEKETLDLKFDQTVSRISRQARSELAVLKSGVEGCKKLAEFTGPIPPPEDKGAVKDYFSDYLEALEGRYLNLDVNEGVPVPGSVPLLGPLMNPDTRVLDRRAHPEEHVEVPLLGIFIGSDVFKGAGEKGYRNLSRKFQSNMEAWVTMRLDWMLERPNLRPQDLESFRQQIADRYERYSKLDGNSAIISLRDLAILEAVANPSIDMIDRVLNDRDDKDIARLEVMQIMNPDAWNKVVRVKGEVVIQQVVSSASEERFIAEVSKYKKVDDFGDAKSEYRRILKERSNVGVNETVSFFRDFNNEVFADILQHSKNIKPAALTMQVYKQLDYLRDGALVPEKDTDRMLVSFMNADRNGRNDILANNNTRQLLLRAIKQATDQYPQIYDKQFKNIPNDVKKLVRSENIETPTHHDRAAQLQALIILGNEAKVIVAQLSRAPEHKGKDFEDEMARIQLPEDLSVVRTGLRHKNPGTGRVVFRSRLDQGGFNTRDLALKGAKMLGVLAVVSNFAQSYSESSGDDFLDRLGNTFENAVSNPGLLAGAAIATGAYVAERDPTLLRWPWLSQHGKAGVVARFKLERLNDRMGRRTVDRFLHNNNEWRALKEPAMSASKINELIKEAGTRSKGGQKPVIKISDLEKVIPDKSITSTLTTGYAGDRMRYLFYSKFMAGSKKPDVNEVKELCTGSSMISDEPNYDNTRSDVRIA